MSNYKNIITKRKYRERGQTADRESKGLLEKHQDYKLRANRNHAREALVSEW
jgi:hypothetical protein